MGENIQINFIYALEGVGVNGKWELGLWEEDGMVNEEGGE